MQSRYGQRAEAQDAERKANTLMDQLQQGVEKAAESVLGSETEALRMARTELDKLIKEAGQEGQDKPDAEKGDAETRSAQASANEPKEGGKPGEAGQSGQGRQQPDGRERNTAGGGGGGGNEGGAFFFDQSAEVANDRPFTGEGYDRWTDRLRNVEELLNQPQLRNEAAKVLDNARAMRIDHERNDAAPQVDHLQMRILNPLVELRDRVAAELAKRDTKNPMVPVDRDPVPPAFRELVKRYYQELGNGN
jgi:hypothetical protein